MRGAEACQRTNRATTQCMMKSAARTMLLRGWDTPNCLVQQFHPAIRSILQRRCRSNYIRASLRSYKSFESSMEQFGLALLHPGTPFLGSLQPESSRRWHTALRAEEGPDNALHPRIKALLIDAAGTLIEPTEPLTDVRVPCWRTHQITHASLPIPTRAQELL